MTVNALDGLGLVQNDILPLHALETLLVGHHDVVTTDDHMEGALLSAYGPLAIEELPKHFPLLEVAPIRQYLEFRREAGDLLLPVVEGGGGGDHQMRTPVVLLLGEVGEEGDGLDSLAESHLVGQDAIDALFVEIV